MAVNKSKPAPKPARRLFDATRDFDRTLIAGIDLVWDHQLLEAVVSTAAHSTILARLNEGISWPFLQFAIRVRGGTTPAIETSDDVYRLWWTQIEALTRGGREEFETQGRENGGKEETLRREKREFDKGRKMEEGKGTKERYWDTHEKNVMWADLCGLSSGEEWWEDAKPVTGEESVKKEMKEIWWD